MLLLSSCVGVGTGEGDVASNASGSLPSSSSDNMDGTANETGTVGSVGEPDTTAGLTGGGTSGTATDGITGGTTAGDTSGTTGATTAGATTGSATPNPTPTITGGATAGTTATAGSTATAGTTTSGGSGVITPIQVSTVFDGADGTFSNNTRTLIGPEAQLFVVNTSSQTLDVISPSTDQDAARFEVNGILPYTLNESTVLSINATDLAIVDNNYPDEILISYSDFNVSASTLTTLLIRESENELNSVPMVTETQTSGPGVAKVRIVQAGTLGDASLESDLQLLSAGNNPGGVDLVFESLSFNLPQSNYQELNAGDYELIDLAGRVTPFPVTLSGGTVYTLLLTGDGVNQVTVIVDSEAPLLNP